MTWLLVKRYRDGIIEQLQPVMVFEAFCWWTEGAVGAVGDVHNVGVVHVGS